MENNIAPVKRLMGFIVRNDSNGLVGSLTTRIGFSSEDVACDVSAVESVADKIARDCGTTRISGVCVSDGIESIRKLLQAYYPTQVYPQS